MEPGCGQWPFLLRVTPWFAVAGVVIIPFCFQLYIHVCFFYLRYSFLASVSSSGPEHFVLMLICILPHSHIMVRKPSVASWKCGFDVGRHRPPLKIFPSSVTLRRKLPIQNLAPQSRGREDVVQWISQNLWGLSNCTPLQRPLAHGALLSLMALHLKTVLP